MLDKKIDSLMALNLKISPEIRDSLKKSITKLDRNQFEQNLIAIKNGIKESIIFSIDEKVIPKSGFTCDFYIHPNANEKGVLCFFPIDLELGRHALKYQKLEYSEKFDRIDTFEVEVPFIYQGN